MTRARFEAKYAAASGMTLDEYYAAGLRGRPCDCGEDNCEGWQTVIKPCAACEHSKTSHFDGRCLGGFRCTCPGFLPTTS